MAIKRWKDEYSVGIELFDNQHKKMFGYLNDLNSALADDEEKKVLAKILLGLITYAKDHFKDEEVNLKKYNYPEYKEHKKEHEELTKEVLRFAEDFKKGNQDITMDVIYFLIKWTVDHIEGSDKKYSKFLKGKEIISGAVPQKKITDKQKEKPAKQEAKTDKQEGKANQQEDKADKQDVKADKQEGKTNL